MARWSFVLAFLGACSLGHAVTVKPHVDNHRCKVACQRFGMKSLGKEFQDIADPTECVSQCDKVYPKDTVALAAKPEPAASLPNKR
mmetsp:Transcript_98718/g.235211  ORF Transcript_98718/g.235211 Transcript_98718/m.235211 type:complete len:86 (+) Transcript_98718:49-306(+)